MSTKMSCCNWKSGGDCDRCGDMISVQKCVTNFEGNEVSEASKMSNLTGGKSETNLPNQLEVIFCQDLNGSLDGVGSADVCDYTCHNDGRFWRCYNFVQETKMGSLV
ncbi:hypothetical protein AABB24_006710 [Solanum stoloniferum]|uniref:Uncharacterized protein n=1 Tax=Solanum stoloniferum TaxID=62892 RepID=A0ABD2V6L7_9SOLN